jgi:replicative DNA helicase
MAANVEYALISRILDYQDFYTVQKARITEEFFLEALCRQVFCFIRDHFTSRFTYGSVPSVEIVAQRFPAFQRAYTNDTVATLCEQLHKELIGVRLRTLADQLYTAADMNPREGIDLVREHSALLTSMHEHSNDLLMSDAYEPLRQEYDRVASGQGLLGIPWPWEIVNDETQGLQGGQFIILFGRPGQMKTWVGLAIGSHAYLAAKQRVLVISMEMKGIDIQRRAASVCARVDYQKWRKAQLQPYDRERLFQWLQFLKDAEHHAGDGIHHPAFLATSGIGGGIGMVRSKIYEFKPDLVIVDGLYRMKDDRTKVRSIDWKNVTNVVQDLNETAKQLDIPIIGITQANRAAAKSSPKDADVSELAFADALGQECDMAIRVKKDRDPQTHESEIIMSFPKSREYEVENVVIHGLPGINFGFKRMWVPQADPGNAPPAGASGHTNGSSKKHDPNAGRAIPKPTFVRT